MTLNDYAKQVHEANAKWWKCIQCIEHPGLIYVCGQMQSGDKTPVEVIVKCPYCIEGKLNRNVGELLMLSTSELSEALEGDRKDLQDDKLPQYKMFDVEIVDAFIRLFDIAAGMDIDLDKIFADKMQFNSVREDHSLAGRLRQNGKKY